MTSHITTNIHNATKLNVIQKPQLQRSKAYTTDVEITDDSGGRFTITLFHEGNLFTQLIDESEGR